VLKLRGSAICARSGSRPRIYEAIYDIESALRARHRRWQEPAARHHQDRQRTGERPARSGKTARVWREKVEQLEGEIPRSTTTRVALSTLTISMFERRHQNGGGGQRERDRQHGAGDGKGGGRYAKAKDAVAQAKGRIVTSALKQFDAGSSRAS